MKSQFHIQASQYREEARAATALRVQKVVAFLRANPLSTAEEVFAGTGESVMIASKYARWTKYGGKTCWRLNHKKINNP